MDVMRADLHVLKHVLFERNLARHFEMWVFRLLNSAPSKPPMAPIMMNISKCWASQSPEALFEFYNIIMEYVWICTHIGQRRNI